MEPPADPTAGTAATGQPAAAGGGQADPIGGERAALSALVAPHWDQTVELAQVLAPGAVEDVLRATVRAAWRYRDQFDPEGAGAGVRTWLLAVVADESRARRGGRRSSGEAGAGGAAAADPDTEWRSALAALPREQRLAAALHDRLGLDLADVADVLGRDTDATEALLAAAHERAGRLPPAAPTTSVPLQPLLEAAATRGPRRSRTLWIAVAAVIAIGIAVPVVAITTRSGGGHHAASTATRIVQVSDAGFTGAVRDPADPKKVYVLVTERAGDPPCLLQNPAATVTAQTAQAVTITVGGQREVPASAAPGQSVTYACQATVYVQVTADLAAPLGDRAVIDAATGKAQPVLDPATVPTPAFVPSGYRAQPVTWQPPTGNASSAGGAATGTPAPSASASSSSTPPETASGGSAASGGPAAGRVPAGWAALRSYTRGSAELDVRVGDPGLLIGANPIATATVGAHPASVTQSGATLCVSWTERAGRAVQVCSAPGSTLTSGPSASLGAPDVAPLDQGQLLRVARSLR